ncbi:MAG: BatA domain-containing protein [Cellvibrionaceae bacterium]
MSFLTPIFLFGLFAAVIPIAIHLIRRDKPPKIVFSTLRFFRQTTRKQFLLQKIQQWLLLLLRAAVVSLLVLAFARPFFSQSVSAWADLAPRSVVVLVDVSLSMGYRDYLDRAKTAARSIINDLNPGDEAAVILFSETARAVYGPTSEFATLHGVIDGIESPEFEKTRYFPAIRLANELLEDSRFDIKLVHLVSDFQNSGMKDFDSNWRLEPGVDFFTENVGYEETKNLAITGVKSPANLRGSEREDELFVRVRTLGSLRLDQAEIAVSINDQEQTRKVVNLQERSETVVGVSVKFAEEGSHVGKASVVDSDFELDNDFYFTVDVLPRIPVLVVNGDASKNWYEDEAHWFTLAASSNQQSPFVLTTVDHNAFDARDLDTHRIAVLLNVGDLSSSQAQALHAFVEAGGSVLFAPGDQVRAGNFNRQLGNVSPATLIDHGNLAANDYLLIAQVENRHPIMRELNVDWGVRFNDYWALKPAESAEVLMKFDNGAPALLEREVGKGRTLIFASTLDLEWNNLPLQGMYLPLIHETLKHLANTPEKNSSYLVGEKVRLQNGAATTNLLDPSGEALTLQEGEDGFTLRRPGVYRRVVGDQTLYYAVNGAAEESDFASVSPAVLVDQVLNPATTPTKSAAVRTQLLKMELEQPQRLWWWLLLLVVLLLLTESFVANRTHR